MNGDELMILAVVAVSAAICVRGLLRSFFREDCGADDWTREVR